MNNDNESSELRLEILTAPSADDYSRLRQFNGFEIYHSAEWHHLLKEAFGWSVQYLCIMDEQNVLVAIPFVQRRKLLKTINHSLPLSHAVPPLVSKVNAVDDIASLLTQQAVNILIHYPIVNSLNTETKWITKLDLANFQSEKEFFSSLHKSSIQRKIRRAEKQGYHAKLENELKSYEEFETLQAETRRAQGSPTFPASYFVLLKKSLGDCVYLTMVRDLAGTPVAGILFIDNPNKTSSLYAYGASIQDADAVSNGINQLSMWKAMSNALERNILEIDMGTTPLHQTGLRQYKEKWGGQSSEITYCKVGATKDTKDTGSALNRTGLMVRIASRVIRNTPLWIFRRCSPYLLKISA